MSEEIEDLSLLDEMDIPEMVRDLDEDFVQKPALQRSSLIMIFGLSSVVFFAIGAIVVWQILLKRAELASAPKPPAQTLATPPQPTTPTPEAQPDQLLGHYAYEEAPASALTAVSSDGRLKLRPAAAQKFEQMQADARSAGINLVLISGFRSVEEQKHLFFEVKEERAQNTEKRAEVSAPPHYSEHHTGYAIDIGDGNTPTTNLSQSFENTAAFLWLQNNAARYSFELSFTKNNPQGIAYEPWHWRFVGDQDSLETFYKSRNPKGIDN